MSITGGDWGVMKINMPEISPSFMIKTFFVEEILIANFEQKNVKQICRKWFLESIFKDFRSP